MSNVDLVKIGTRAVRPVFAGTSAPMHPIDMHRTLFTEVYRPGHELTFRAQYTDGGLQYALATNRHGADVLVHEPQSQAARNDRRAMQSEIVGLPSLIFTPGDNRGLPGYAGSR